MLLNDPEAAGPRIADRYKVEGQLAQGGMGTIYRVLDESTGNRVVLKRLLPELARRPNVALLFQREYHTLSQLSHPRIIAVHDYGVDDEGPYYTMELLDGQDVRELSPLPPAEACAYLRDVASSLSLLHTRRLLHRDLNPRNVRRTSDGHVKLLDFGTMASFGVPDDVVGTPPFVPPEALRGVALDHRADLYSLGALAYWLLARRHAYRARHIEDLPGAWQVPPSPPSRLVDGVPPELDELVMSLLSLDPTARPSSAADVIERLGHIGDLPPEPNAPAVAASYLLTSRLVGRRREMERIHRRLDRALTGRGSAILVEANPGVGRTRLAGELALAAQLRGALVLSARASGAPEPYALVQRLVHGLLRNAPSQFRHAVAPYLPVLGHLLPELVDAGAELAVMSDDPAEARARQQAALASVVLEICRQRPLVIVVDDLQRADEASAALLASLAQQCRGHALVVAATVKLGARVVAPDALRSLRGEARVLRLHRLTRPATVELVESIFGVVPNVERLAHWMHDVTTGNPTHLLELARSLVEAGTLQFLDGSWVLPLAIAETVAPKSMAQMFGARVDSLGADARALAGALAVRQAPTPLPLAVAISGTPTLEALFTRIDELTQKGVLETSPAGLRFTHEALRELLLGAMSDADRNLRSRRLGEALLERAGDDNARIEAGLHLMLGGDELRGADVVADAAAHLDLEGGSQDALPALEEAVAVYERQGASFERALRLRTTLVVAGYNFDRRIAYRYGDDTVRVLFELSGLAAAGQLQPYLGRRVGLFVGFALAALRRALTPAARRPPPVARCTRYLLRAVTNYMGALAVSLDVAGIRHAVAYARPLSGFPSRHAGHAVHLFCSGLWCFLLGREGEHRACLERVAALLSDPDACREIPVDYREGLLVGTLMSLGVGQSTGLSARGLEIAARLDRLGTQLAQVAAHRVRLVHHLMRGEVELAEPHRKKVEEHGVQGGSTWQVELWSMALEGLASQVSEDHIRFRQLRRAIDGIEREVPSLGIYGRMMDVQLLRRDGQLAEAVALAEDVAERMPPGRHQGWDVVRLSLAELLLERGEPSRAAQVCRESLSVYRSGTEGQVVRVMIERLQALAEAASGNVEAGRKRLARLLEAHRGSAHPLVLGRLHQAAAELALEVGDAEAVVRHLGEMRRWLEPTRNPALLALLQSLAQRAQARGLHGPIEDLDPDEEDDATTMVAGSRVAGRMVRMFEGVEGDARAELALRVLINRADALGGYLYVRDGAELSLRARLNAREPSEGLEQRVRSRLDEAGTGSVEDTSVVTDLETGEHSQRHRLVVLPGVGTGAPAAVAVAVLAVDRAPTEPLPEGLLRALGEQLALPQVPGPEG